VIIAFQSKTPGMKKKLDSVVIDDAKFSRVDHSSIPVTAIGRGLKSLDARTDKNKKYNVRKIILTKFRSSQDYKIIDLEMIYNFLSLNYYC
jgi:hypothetical protein